MGDSELKPGQVIPGTIYQVLRLLGSGGMGSVYEVEHTELGKRFVIKALRGSLSSRKDLALRMRNEWRALGRLEHPNIVIVTDAGVTPRGTPYFVMERLVGETLGSRLKHGRPFHVLEALHVATQILDGLHAAHGIGIVHRDVKPQNIILIEGGIVKLVDFGIAKTLDREAAQITGRGVAIGTPRYMAPEQASGASVDERIDVYATGLVLYEMLTGRGPFDDLKDPNEIFLAHVTKVPPRLRTLVPDVPPDLEEITARALAKAPAHRPRSAAEMAAALRDVASRLAQRPSVPSLPDWISSGPTVPGGAPETGTSASLDDRSVVTRTLAGTRDTEGAVPDFGTPSSDPASPTRTLTLSEPEGSPFRPADLDEPETRTALGVEESTTAPPVATGGVPSVHDGRRSPLVWVALVAAGCGSAAVTMTALWSFRSEQPAVAVKEATLAPAGVTAAGAALPDTAHPDPELDDGPQPEEAAPAPAALSTPPPVPVADPQAARLREQGASISPPFRAASVARVVAPAVKAAPETAAPVHESGSEAPARSFVPVVDGADSPWNRTAASPPPVPVSPQGAAPARVDEPRKRSDLPSSGL